MNPSWRQQLADYIRIQAQPVDKFSHQPRLYALACELADGLSVDDDILYAACWLHDLGVFIGHRPEDPALLATWDNVAYAIAQTPSLLLRLGFPPEKNWAALWLETAASDVCESVTVYIRMKCLQGWI